MEAVVIDCFTLETHHRTIRSPTGCSGSYILSCCICAFHDREGQRLPRVLTIAWSAALIGGFA